jgi:hypothetical protein
MKEAQKRQLFAAITIVAGLVLTYFVLLILEDNLAPGSPPPDLGTIAATVVSLAIVVYSGIQWKRIKA